MSEFHERLEGDCVVNNLHHDFLEREATLKLKDTRCSAFWLHIVKMAPIELSAGSRKLVVRIRDKWVSRSGFKL